MKKKINDSGSEDTKKEKTNIIRFPSEKRSLISSSDGQSTIDRLEDPVQIFANIASSISKATSAFVNSISGRQPFYKQTSFWSALVLASGLLGLTLSWQQQIRDMKVKAISSEIQRLEEIKRDQNKAFIFTRFKIQNQIISCPENNISKLKAMKIDRNNSLIPLTANVAFLENGPSKGVIPLIRKFTATVYNLTPTQICKINPNRFDKKLFAYELKADDIINRTIESKSTLLKQIENSIIAI